MAFVDPNKRDVFVSYAHVDNQPLAGSDGWITTLIYKLKTILAEKLGRDVADIWMDPRLAGNVPIDDELMSAVQSSATLLVVLSKGYVASEWCQRERNKFLTEIAQRLRSKSRVFIVEYNKVDDNERPQEFGTLLGYKFWVADRLWKSPRTLGWPTPKSEDESYYGMLSDLCHDLAEELRKLRGRGSSQDLHRSEPARELVANRSKVFLAEVTDDLEPIREETRRYLVQKGLEVVPDSWYPRTSAESQSSCDRDLAKSELFVQLLSAVAGKKPSGESQSYVRLQYERAKAAHKPIPIIQWRDKDLDTGAVKDPDHRCLLQAETVRAVGIEEFKRTVVEKAFYVPPSPPRKPVGVFVFVNLETHDRDLAETICKLLDQYEIGYSMPSKETSGRRVRKELQDNLANCNGLIVVYGQSTVEWVRAQLMEARKSALNRPGSPLQAIAVYEAPPTPKAPLDMKLPGMKTLEWRGGLNEPALRGFLEELLGKTPERP